MRTEVVRRMNGLPSMENGTILTQKAGCWIRVGIGSMENVIICMLAEPMLQIHGLMVIMLMFPVNGFHLKINGYHQENAGGISMVMEAIQEMAGNTFREHGIISMQKAGCWMKAGIGSVIIAIICMPVEKWRQTHGSETAM